MLSDLTPGLPVLDYVLPDHTETPYPYGSTSMEQVAGAVDQYAGGADA